MQTSAMSTDAIKPRSASSAIHSSGAASSEAPIRLLARSISSALMSR